MLYVNSAPVSLYSPDHSENDGSVAFCCPRLRSDLCSLGAGQLPLQRQHRLLPLPRLLLCTAPRLSPLLLRRTEVAAGAVKLPDGVRLEEDLP